MGEKCNKYEQEIMDRTQTIKDKNRHLSQLSEETSKVTSKAEGLAKMA